MTPPLTFPPRPSLPLDGGSWSDVPGAQCGVAKGRIKLRADRDDVVVLFTPGGSVAGVTTRSTAAAAPCRWTRDRLPGRASAVVINSGNANAATGRQGEADTLATAEAVAAVLGVAPDEVLVCSTGVIGQPMPMDRLLPAAREAAANLGDHGHRAAKAILTTDLVVKEVGLVVDGIRFGGMAKGSGMIHPNMATMLAFVATDVKLAASRALVASIADHSFNAVHVDTHPSTNDTFLLLSTGRRAADDGAVAAITAVSRRLAWLIARDGEGSGKVTTIRVTGATSNAAAKAIATKVASSALVRTALYGNDPNWGRFTSQVANADETVDASRLRCSIQGVPVFASGCPLVYDRAAVSRAMGDEDVELALSLEDGQGEFALMTSDLGYRYVEINAEYTT